MQQNGYGVEAIAGCSMGGIVGALFANGMSPGNIHSAFEDLNELELLDFGAMGGIIGGKGIGRKLTSYLPSTFEQLSLPLKVTAVDLQAGTLAVLGTGPLISALLATSALPGILSPVRHDGRLFLDGGLLNNLPVDVIRTMTSAPVVAVDVSAPPNRRLDVDRDEGMLDKLKKITRREFRTLTIELFMKSFDIPASLVTEMRLSLNPPDVLVRPALKTNFGVEDFHRLDDALDEGRRAAERAFATVDVESLFPAQE
jgi:NTE family protein